MKLKFFIASIIVIIFNTSGLYGQMKHRYIGIHYEYGATLNLRYARLNGNKGHYFFEAAVPRLIASLCGWNAGDKAYPVLHGRYLSMRAGKQFKLGKQSGLGFDVLWEWTGVACPPDSDETKKYTGYMTMPLCLGIAYSQSFGDNFSFVLIPAYGYACTKTRNNDGKQHTRASCDIYFQYKASDDITFYGGAGYVYYPKGLPLTYPRDASFGGPVASLGIAFTTSW